MARRSPDTVCEVHGVELAVHLRKDGYLYRYCNECRRDKRNPAKRQGGERCWKGHLKTPWSWRWNAAARAYYCLTCKNAREREYYHRKRQAAA